MNDQLFVGIDNGTQGTKCAVFSLSQSRILASAYAPHDLIENDAGRREQDPAWWIAAATATLDECLGAAGVDRQKVVAIGVSGQQHGFVPLDAVGEVIRPAKLWCDTETVAECEAITAAVGGADKVMQAIGNTIAVGFTASKVRWLRDHEPHNYARLATMLLPHDYLNFWLTGECKTEYGDASGTAYFDVRQRRWSETMLRAIDPDGRLLDCLPELIESDAPVGRLRPEIAARFGLSPEVLVSSGGGDNMMAAIGTGNVAPGIVTASLGTSGTIYAYADQPVTDPQGELAAFCSSSGGWLPLVCTMNVTVATEETRQLLGLEVHEFDALVEQASPGAGGLLLLPYFNGERTPALPTARASFSGISSTNFTRENLCRAAMEGATLGLRYGLDVLRREGVQPQEIRLVGGGARSRIWRQIAADIFNCPIVCPVSTEAGVMGAALQAAWCWSRQQGTPTELASLTASHISTDESTRTLPHSGRAAQYDEIYQQYLKFNEAMTPLWR